MIPSRMRLQVIIFCAFALLPGRVFAQHTWRLTTGGAFPGRPIVAESGTVYAASDDRFLYAVNGSTGEVIWRAHMGDRPNGSISLSFDGTVLVGTRRKALVAINSRGSEIWRFTFGAKIVGDPAIGADGTVFVALADGTLCALSHRGTLLFLVTFSEGDSASAGPSITSSGSIIVPAEDNRLYALERNGSALWNVVLAGVPTSVSVNGDDVAYVGTDFGSIVAVSQGGEILWDYVEESGVLPPVLAPDGVFCVTGSGVVAKLSLDGLLLWRFPTRFRFVHVPVADRRGRVLLESDAGELVCVGEEGVVDSPHEFVSDSSGMTMGVQGSVFVGVSAWQLFSFPTGSSPAAGWSQVGLNGSHVGSVDRAESGAILDEQFREDPEYVYMSSLLNFGGYAAEKSVLSTIESLIHGQTARGAFRYLRRVLESLAGEGLVRIEHSSHTVLNDYPEVRAAALDLLPAVAGIRTNLFIAQLLSFEYDLHTIGAAMRAAGAIGSDGTGAATRAIDRVIEKDISASIAPSEALGYAALDAIRGIIAYHGEPTDPAGLKMLLMMLHADYSRDLRESVLGVIRSIHYY